KYAKVDKTIYDFFLNEKRVSLIENEIYKFRKNGSFSIEIDKSLEDFPKNEVAINSLEFIKWFNMKYYLGIDPGKQGAFVVIDENSTVIEKIGTPLIGKEYDRQAIVAILTKHKYHKIGLENPDVIFGIGKSAVASLSHCVGLIEGIMIGLKTP